MKLHLALEEKKLDLRLRDRLVADGKLETKEVKEYLDSLADEEGNYKEAGEVPQSEE